MQVSYLLTHVWVIAKAAHLTAVQNCVSPESGCSDVGDCSDHSTGIPCNFCCVCMVVPSTAPLMLCVVPWLDSDAAVDVGGKVTA